MTHAPILGRYKMFSKELWLFRVSCDSISGSAGLYKYVANESWSNAWQLLLCDHQHVTERDVDHGEWQKALRTEQSLL
jgi:hypothetical protein